MSPPLFQVMRIVRPYTISATDLEIPIRKVERLTTGENTGTAEALRILPLTPLNDHSHLLGILPLTPLNDHSPLLNLPPEVRTMILEELLDLGVVHITMRYGKQSAFHDRDEEPSTGRKLDLSIARVNKQLKEESEAIAYGNNRFCFAGRKEIQAFMAQSSRPCLHLKHVQFGARFHTSAYYCTELLNALATCTNIRTITIPHEQACMAMRQSIHFLALFRRVAYMVWNDARNQLAALRHTQQQQGRGSEFPQLIIVATPLLNCGECEHAHTIKFCPGDSGCKTTCGSMAEHCDELSKRYNTMLATYFEDPKQGFELFQKVVEILPKGPGWKDGVSDRFIE